MEMLCVFAVLMERKLKKKKKREVKCEADKCRASHRALVNAKRVASLGTG